MKNVLIVYIITQLVTTAYGVSVIESARPFIESKLRDQGYHKNKNSLYRFNNTLSNILKAFIPFYYFAKALGIVINKGNVDKQVNEAIDSKNYVLEDEIEAPELPVTEESKEDIVSNLKIEFEKPERYTARKNNIDYLETKEEDEVEYITRESTDKDELSISPFVSNDTFEEVKDIIIVKDEEEQIEEKVKEETHEKDFSLATKAICDLNADELHALNDMIKRLETIKRKNKSLNLTKDVA